jgi:integrase
MRGLKRALQAKPHEKVFPFSYSAFRRMFRAAVTQLGFSLKNFRTHSLRRGGATAMLYYNKNLEAIVLQGRWASLASARVYLRLGQALMAKIQGEMQEATKAMIARLVVESLHIF